MSKEILIISSAYLILTSLHVSAFLDPCASCVAPNAQCVNGSCVCPENCTGNPYVRCHHVNNLYCQLLNDPTLTDFANARVKVHVIGSTRFAQFTTKRTGGNDVCDFTLFAAMERIRGKIFPKLIEFILIFPLVSNPSTTITFSLRLDSIRQSDGSIVWQYFAGSQGSGILTLNLLITFNLCSIQLNVHSSRFVLVGISCCGIQFGIRPYTGDSLYAPALFVEIDSNNQPAFNNWRNSLQPLCLDQGSFTIADEQTAANISDPSKAMTYLANTNTFNWNYLNVIFNDYILLSNLRGCPANRVNTFFNYAWFAFTNAPFIKCISGNLQTSDDLYTFIKLSINYACYNLLSSCINSKTLVQNNCNTTQFPYLQDFVNSPCVILP